jgi:hypothetical protein
MHVSQTRTHTHTHTHAHTGVYTYRNNASKFITRGSANIRNLIPVHVCKLEDVAHVIIFPHACALTNQLCMHICVHV